MFLARIMHVCQLSRCCWGPHSGLNLSNLPLLVSPRLRPATHHSRLCCLLCGHREPGVEYPPFTAYWKPAITNCLGPACGLEALKFISYPAQAGRAAVERAEAAGRVLGEGPSCLRMQAKITAQ